MQGCMTENEKLTFPEKTFCEKKIRTFGWKKKFLQAFQKLHAAKTFLQNVFAAWKNLEACKNFFSTKSPYFFLQNVFAEKNVVREGGPKIFALAKICSFLVDFEKIRHKRAISFWLDCHYYLFGLRRLSEDAITPYVFCLVIERTKSVLSFLSELQVNIYKFVSYSWLQITFSWFEHLCCFRIISKF